MDISKLSLREDTGTICGTVYLHLCYNGLDFSHQLFPLFCSPSRLALHRLTTVSSHLISPPLCHLTEKFTESKSVRQKNLQNLHHLKNL